MISEVLKAYNLSKDFKNCHSINKINISVKRGEIYTLLGRSDSGVNTIIRMFTGLVRPTSGSIELFGREVNTSEYRYLRRVGSTLTEPGLYPNLTVFENMELHRRLMSIPDSSYVEQALKRLGLYEYKHHIVKNLSFATKQKISLARALVHNPDLLILEDPLSGLDPAGIRDIRKLLLDLSLYQRVTVILSTNILSEADQIASRIGIVHKGSLVDEIDPLDFCKANRNYIELKVNDTRKASLVFEEKMGIHDYRIVQNNLIQIYNSKENTADINRTLMQEGISVIEIRIETNTLEDHFLSLTGG